MATLFLKIFLKHNLAENFEERIGRGILPKFLMNIPDLFVERRQIPLVITVSLVANREPDKLDDRFEFVFRGLGHFVPDCQFREDLLVR